MIILQGCAENQVIQKGGSRGQGFRPSECPCGGAASVPEVISVPMVRKVARTLEGDVEPGLVLDMPAPLNLKLRKSSTS